MLVLFVDEDRTRNLLNFSTPTTEPTFIFLSFLNEYCIITENFSIEDKQLSLT
jgi:hypothetical protein